MGRADEIRAKYEAELAMVEAEDRLVAAKAKRSISADELRQIKDEVREARRVFREQRDAEDGDAVARPATVRAATAVKKAR